ncbi:MAG: hypothetical protein U9Q29_03210 [Campylobacterota bacterium]|nr:hypothetical protein [Campylobacterota bacterium]
MNEMYDMSIVTHNYGVMLVLAAILVNIFMLLRAEDIKKYARSLRIFMPIGMTTIGTVIFTGVVMMAAKHLDFSIENIVMILFAVVLIVLENMRSSKLKFLNRNEESAFKNYKSQMMKIFMLEVVLVLGISVWMWM